jgi:glycogen debranching enzyme
MTESIRIHNLANEAAALTVEIVAGTDFADLFDVKEGRIPPEDHTTSSFDERGLTLRREQVGIALGTRVSATSDLDTPHRLSKGRISWHFALEPRAEWSCEVMVEALINDTPIASLPQFEEGERAAIKRLRAWRVGAPVVTSPNSGLARTLSRSLEDLGALRMIDPRNPDRIGVAAGAPWFMATFGRDSLLTSWMVLPLDLRLSLGVLQTLAEMQGSRTVALTEEEPGRILHELRRGPASSLPLGPGGAYYGSIDATPLFVMLLGELRRWGQAPDDVDALLPHADRALDWIVNYGDRDGDGFVEYRRATDRGLPNQGWKDSADSLTFADGTFAEAPIALAEVQGYSYAAFLARAHFAVEMGDKELADSWIERAMRLKAAFNEAFWLPDKGYYAIALDKHKRPVDSLASNMGHCLWTGIIDEAHAESVVAHLMSDEMFSGWGIRTLATSMAAYNPMSYHNGSVWPHDNAIIAAGLSRYGFVAEAERVAVGVLDAAELLDGRLPELFCGMSRADFPRPIPYPTACAPQAWAAATPFLMLRTLLRLEPRLPVGEVRLAPVLPAAYLPLRVSNLSLGGRRISIDMTAEGFSVEGLAPDVRVVAEPRPVMTPLHL